MGLKQNKSHIIQFLVMIWLLRNSVLVLSVLLQYQIKVSFYISIEKRLPTAISVFETSLILIKHSTFLKFLLMFQL